MTSPIDLYHRLPVWTQNLAISLYGARLRWQRYGGVHQQVLRELQATEKLSYDEVQDRQLQQLFGMLHNAARFVPFYASIHGDLPTTPDNAMDALRTWPVLSKQQVQAAGRSLVSTEPNLGPLTEVHTGGTTGRALSVWADHLALRRNYAFFERFKSWTEVSATARVATFAGRAVVAPTQHRPPFWRMNRAARQLLCSSYHISPETVEDYVRGLEAFDPFLIDSYPSSIEPIARAIVSRGGTSLRVRAVITSSETLFPHVRSLVEAAFGCRVYDHYGSAEMVAFLAQCSAGSYHARSDFGVLELLDHSGDAVAPGKSGEIVATGFINRAMPLIRYRMGDEAALSEQRCACNLPFPVVSEIKGRIDDVILTPEGRRIGRIDPIFKAVSSLHEARVVQTHLDEVRLDLVVGDTFLVTEQDELVRQLSMRLGPTMRISVQRVSSIPRTASGKLQTVVSPFARVADTAEMRLRERDRVVGPE